MSDTLVALRTLAGETVARTGASVIVLFAANVGILFLYIAYDLSVAQLAIVYWWESLWIGFFCVVKLITVCLSGKPYRNRWANGSRVARGGSSIVLIALVAAQCFVVFSGLRLVIAQLLGSTTGNDPATMLVEFGLLFGLSLIFLVGHSFSYLVNFLALGEYKTARARPLLTLPLVRSAALFVAVGLVAAGMSMFPGLGTRDGFAFLVIAVKLAVDYRLHLYERRALNVL